MKSPFTGKEMLLVKEKRTHLFRKEEFEILHHSYLCEETGEQVETDELTDLNLTQVYNQYRERLNLPFPEEIREIRRKYGLSASKISEILGFGINTYRNYEAGEIPTTSSARLIQSASCPKEFRTLVHLSQLAKDEKVELLSKIDYVIGSEDKIDYHVSFLDSGTPSAYNGYRKLNIEKSFNLLLYIADRLQPWKTQLNKLLFYCDFTHFKRSGYSITGLQYCAYQRGPVPNRYEVLFSFGEEAGFIERTPIDRADGWEGEKLSSNPSKEFNESLFSSDELDVMNHVVNTYGKLTTKQIIAHSHQEKGWIDNEPRRAAISFDYAFSLLEPPK